MVMLTLSIGCTTSDPSIDGGIVEHPVAAAIIGAAVCPFEAVCGVRPTFLGSCMGRYTDDDWVSEISDERRGHAARVIPCVLEATSCEEYFACVRSDESCTANRCEGSVLAGCVDGFVERFDCTSEGLDCVDSGMDPARCSLAGSMCGSEELSCEGDVFLWCPVRGQVTPFGFNCGHQGKECSRGFCADPGSIACTQNTCSEDGVEITYCIDGISSTFRCANADDDHRCFEESDAEATCGMPTAECEEFDDRCEGDVAVICSHGKEYALDCTRAGASCVEQSGTANCVLE